MAGLGDAVSATNLDDAAKAVVATLGPPVGVWQTVEGDRFLLAGDASAQGASATVTGLCRGTVEVVGDVDATLLEAAAAVVAQVADRLEIEDRARRSRRRLADSERIGALGAYAWIAATDELQWTDGLFRIFGREPGEFDPTYDRFVEHLHPEDRDRVREVHETALRTGEPFEVEERIVRPDGEIRTLSSIGEISVDVDGTPTGLVGVCRDVTEQREAERQAADADLRRRQALELNDNVIQGLVGLLWHLDPGQAEAKRIAEATLAAARRMVTDLLRDTDGADRTMLVRRTPADLLADTSANVLDMPVASASTTPRGSDGSSLDMAAAAPRTIRVVVADDMPPLRMMLRLRLSKEDHVEVVGEAGDGHEVVQLVERLRPDVVVMDLSMPGLDGLHATRRIRELAPATRVVVLSGYPAEAMAEQALAAGAACYLEKSGDLDELCAVVTGSRRSGDLGP